MPEQIADRYISKGGRMADYSRDAATEDLMTLSLFLLWAEEDRAVYGGHDAREAFQAMCRILDIDKAGLRKAIMDNAK